MLHPLLGEEFINLTMEEIQEKITQLNKRLLVCNNMNVARQLRMILEELYNLSTEKMRAEIEKQEKERQAKLEKAKKELDNIQ